MVQFHSIKHSIHVIQEDISFHQGSQQSIELHWVELPRLDLDFRQEMNLDQASEQVVDFHTLEAMDSMLQFLDFEIRDRIEGLGVLNSKELMHSWMRFGVFE